MLYNSFLLIIIVIVIIFSNHQDYELEDYDDHHKADNIEAESLHPEIYEDTKKLSFNKTLQTSPYSSEEDGLINNNDDELTEEDDEFEKSEINDGMLNVTLLIIINNNTF